MFKVLFVDSSSQYRSKFAEFYFNSICVEKGINALAYSACFKKPKDSKKVLALVSRYLDQMGVENLKEDKKLRVINELLISASNKVICMDMEEQLTLMRKTFPEQVRKATYWHFKSSLHPEHILPRIKIEVDHLVASLMITESLEHN